jgi:hypothetical protein
MTLVTARSTSKARLSRNQVATVPGGDSGSAAAARQFFTRENSLPEALILAIDGYRKTLQIALTLLTSVDATLEQEESGGGDILNPDDADDALILKARVIARPLEMVRLVIQRVYEVYSGLDALNLRQIAGRKK